MVARNAKNPVAGFHLSPCSGLFYFFFSTVFYCITGNERSFLCTVRSCKTRVSRVKEFIACQALNLHTQALEPEVIENLRKEAEVTEHIQDCIQTSSHLIVNCRSGMPMVDGFYCDSIHWSWHAMRSFTPRAVSMSRGCVRSVKEHDSRFAPS